jgi:hypothetical protein
MSCFRLVVCLWGTSLASTGWSQIGGEDPPSGPIECMKLVFDNKSCKDKYGDINQLSPSCPTFTCTPYGAACPSIGVKHIANLDPTEWNKKVPYFEPPAVGEQGEYVELDFRECFIQYSCHKCRYDMMQLAYICDIDPNVAPSIMGFNFAKRFTNVPCSHQESRRVNRNDKALVLANAK